MTNAVKTHTRSLKQPPPHDLVRGLGGGGSRATRLIDLGWFALSRSLSLYGAAPLFFFGSLMSCGAPLLARCVRRVGFRPGETGVVLPGELGSCLRYVYAACYLCTVYLVCVHGMALGMAGLRKVTLFFCHLYACVLLLLFVKAYCPYGFVDV